MKKALDIFYGLQLNLYERVGTCCHYKLFARMNPKETLTKWLQDAYTMETSIIPVLEDQVESVRDFPAIHAKIQEHLLKTRGHAEAVQEALRRLGGDVPALTSGAAAANGWIGSLAPGLAKDQAIKNAIADYSAEQFEIAAYTALIAAAEELGDQATIDTCEKILADEEEMAAWLADQLPDTVAEFLRKED